MVVQETPQTLNATQELVNTLNESGTGLLFLGGVLIALIITMRGIRRGSSRRKAQTNEMGGHSSRLAQLHEEANASVGPARKALLDLEESARRFGALLDTKSAKLEILIEQADERIEQLEQAETSQNTSQHDVPRVRGLRPEALDRARVDEDLAARSRPDHDQDPVTETTADSVNASMKIDDAPQSSKRVRTTQEHVAELADLGMSAPEIAKEIDRPIGQVELMLNIWRNSG